MILWFISSLLLINATSPHDYHTTLMSMQYNAAIHAFEMELTVETDHFEYVLNKNFLTDIHLGENKEIEDCNALIDSYLNQTIQLYINKKPVTLSLAEKEVDYSITTLKFRPAYHKKKVKHITMKNKMMFHHFPKQQNLVQIFYKDKKAGFLFGGELTEESIKF